MKTLLFFAIVTFVAAVSLWAYYVYNQMWTEMWIMTFVDTGIYALIKLIMEKIKMQ